MAYERAGHVSKFLSFNSLKINVGLKKK